MSALADLRRELAERWRAAFASGEAFGHRHGLLLRTDFAEALDDAREEREARIRVEAYAAGREAGLRSGRVERPAATCTECGRDLRVIAAGRVTGYVTCPHPCPNGRHAWRGDRDVCDCGAVERF